MEIKTFVFNPFQENTYVVYDETKEALIIDAGCSNQQEFEELEKFIAGLNLQPKALVNTHCHIDHVLGLRYLHDKYNLPFWANKNDYYLITSAVDQGAMFGLEVELPPAISAYIDEDNPVKFGNSELKVLHVPGHSLGHVALYAEADNFILAGDVLFNGSIGRTDLPGGDYDMLIESIRTKLLTLPGNTTVYPGHGPATTIGQETKLNPFLK